MRKGILAFCAAVLCTVISLAQAQGPAVFNVKDFGATGNKADDARPAIQAAIDACHAAGGGAVVLPAGEFTSGALTLRSHVRVVIEAGATLFASRDPRAFDARNPALFFGQDLEHVTVEGRGTVDGQAEYEWRLNDWDDAYIKDNQLLMEAAGQPTLRSFPKKAATPKMFLLLRCRDVRIAGLNLLRSPSWTIHPYGCERMVIDGVNIFTSLEEGVWADGIDPDGCRDLRIANSTIVTGDDAIVFYSMNWFGPALPCENITVTNCRLSSASSALKFCDGNMNCVRRVTVSNCVITNSNRGLAFMVFDGGTVSDVVINGLTIECTRHKWFWWGDGDPFHFNIKRRSEIHGQPPRPGEPAAGRIRDVLISNVIARAKGTSNINGHPDSWLEGVTFDNVKLFLSHDPGAQVQKAKNAINVRWARNLKLRDFEVLWDKPESERWESAMTFEDVEGLTAQGLSVRQARLGAPTPALLLDRVVNAVFRNSRAQAGTSVFLEVWGAKTQGVVLAGNDLREAAAAFRIGPSAKPGSVILAGHNLEKK